MNLETIFSSLLRKQKEKGKQLANHKQNLVPKLTFWFVGHISSLIVHIHFLHQPLDESDTCDEPCITAAPGPPSQPTGPNANDLGPLIHLVSNGFTQIHQLIHQSIEQNKQLAIGLHQLRPEMQATPSGGAASTSRDPPTGSQVRASKLRRRRIAVEDVDSDDDVSPEGGDIHKDDPSRPNFLVRYKAVVDSRRTLTAILKEKTAETFSPPIGYLKLPVP